MKKTFIAYLFIATYLLGSRVCAQEGEGPLIDRVTPETFVAGLLKPAGVSTDYSNIVLSRSVEDLYSLKSLEFRGKFKGDVAILLQSLSKSFFKVYPIRATGKDFGADLRYPDPRITMAYYDGLHMGVVHISIFENEGGLTISVCMSSQPRPGVDLSRE